MSNENTARRGLYLPTKLDQLLIDQADVSGVKVNTIIISALNEYMNSKSKHSKKNDADFDKKVRCIIEKFLEEKGYDKL